MSDIVAMLLFRSSDEAGIGWLPGTVVHVPAGLLHQAADEITRLCAAINATAEVAVSKDAECARLRAENARLRKALAEAIEFAGQDHMVLTPTGEAMVARWRAALAAEKEKEA